MGRAGKKDSEQLKQMTTWAQSTVSWTPSMVLSKLRRLHFPRHASSRLRAISKRVCRLR